MIKQNVEQLGICSWSLLPESGLDLAAKVQACGLKKVQLAMTEHRGNEGHWRPFAAALQDAGIEIVSGMIGTKGEDYSTPESIHRTGGVVPDETWEENLERVEASVKGANDLGISYISTHAGFLPESDQDPTFEKLLSRIETIANIYGEHGLSLLFETGQETAATLNMFLDALADRGATNVGVNFDPANMFLYDMGDPIPALRDLAPRLLQVHIKDGLPPEKPGEWGTEVPVNSGRVDWTAFFDVLNDAGYMGDLIIEREGGDDRVGDVTRSIEFVTGLMTDT